jgi:hypothetical protein
VAALDDAVAAFNPTERIKGKTIIRVPVSCHASRTRDRYDRPKRGRPC